METIRNYLESMFANLPNTPDVLRAKEELYQMMEDKYNELISEGRTPNEAVGVVISEFGNLDELSESLGISGIVRNQMPFQGRMLTQDEVRSYINEKGKSALHISIGVLLCIVSPAAFILAEAVVEGFHTSERVPFGIGAFAFFAMLAAAIGIFVYNGIHMEKWSFLNRQPCGIDYATAECLHNQREANRTSYAVLKTIGILLCVVCFVPVAVMGAMDVQNDAVLMIGVVMLFVLLGIGVMLLINAGGKDEAYLKLLQLNDRRQVGGNYVPSQQEERYSNDTVARIMKVYYPTVLCVYLCWSFITFDWHITWIIWPIAAIVKYWIRAVWGEKPGQMQ